MSDQQNKQTVGRKRAGGLLASLLGGGSSSGSGLAAILGTKAGLAGALVAGTTIAAGVGVVMNLNGGSAGPGQYEEAAVFETPSTPLPEDPVAGDASDAYRHEKGKLNSDSLAMFRAKANEEGYSGLARYAPEDGGESAEDGAGEAATRQSASAAAPAAAGRAVAGGGAKPQINVPKMQKGSGLSGLGAASGGSSASSGFSGSTARPAQLAQGPTAGNPAFEQMNRVEGMKRDVARRFKGGKLNSLKANGAFAQAKLAGDMSQAAAFSAGADHSAALASQPFDGGAGAGSNEGIGVGGVGAGGSGLGGDGSTPNSNNTTSSSHEAPDAPEAMVGEAPWKKWQDMAMYAMMAAVVLMVLSSMIAKSKNPWAEGIAKVLAWMACVAGAVVAFAGIMLAKEGQKWGGGMYMVLGTILAVMAGKAAMGIGAEDAGTTSTTATEAATAQTGGTNPMLMNAVVGGAMSGAQSAVGKESELADQRHRDGQDRAAQERRDADRRETEAERQRAIDQHTNG